MRPNTCFCACKSLIPLSFTDQVGTHENRNFAHINFYVRMEDLLCALQSFKSGNRQLEINKMEKLQSCPPDLHV
jgi:hypothetical protein